MRIRSIKPDTGPTPRPGQGQPGILGAQIKTTPGAALVTPIPPEGLAINELDRSSDD